MLWLCLHLPQLPLEALPAVSPEIPTAVLDSRQRLLRINEAAAQAGLQHGWLSGSALAICPNLRCHARDESAETKSLHRLAEWALQFSSWVSLAPPAELLLEIGGSLAFFGGLDKLLAGFEKNAQPLGFSIQTGIAPTPLAAQVLARRGDQAAVQNASALRQTLESIPLACLGWEAADIHRLQSAGLERIGDILKLPRDAFEQRHGRDKGRQLEQLLGHIADPREAFRPAPIFQKRLDATQDSRCLDELLPGFDLLFAELAQQLIQQDLGVTELNILLHHGSDSRSHFQLPLNRPSRDPAHWRELVQQHWERCDIQAEVRAIELRAQQFQSPSQAQSSFWGGPGDNERQALWERLVARLGPGQIYALRSTQSHHPELAWRRSDIDSPIQPGDESRPRPLWLLPQPEAVCGTQLTAISAPERLETDWWQQHCRRDYYRARDRQGRRLWVFREHGRPDNWFIQGFFA